jgi:hypothetical protein
MADRFEILPMGEAPQAERKDQASRYTVLPPETEPLPSSLRYQVLSPGQAARSDPAGVLEGFFKPFRDIIPEQQAATSRAAAEMYAGANEAYRGPTLFDRALGGLKFLGGATSWVASPFESTARAFLGNPLGDIVEQQTGSKKAGQMTRDLIGDTASIAGSFALDPLAGIAAEARAGKVAGAINPATGKPVSAYQQWASGQTKPTFDPISLATAGVKGVTGSAPFRALQARLSPTTMTPQSALIAGIIKDHNAQLNQAERVAREAVNRFQMTMREQPKNVRFEFIDRMESGQQQALSELDPVADTLRFHLDQARDRVRSLGKGVLETYMDNYFPHLWKNPTGAATPRSMSEMLAQAEAKSPLRGSQAFRKKRSIDSFADGIARGLEPVTNDPLEMALLKINELNKFYYGTRMADEIKKSGVGKFYRSLGQVPSGWVELKDRAFRAILPPAKVVQTAIHETAYDPKIRQGLQRIADALNIPITTPLRHEDPSLASSFGYTYMRGPGTPDPVVSRFGNELQVMEHELGHQLDNRFGLSTYMMHDTQAWQELGDLAEQRWIGTIPLNQRQHLDRFKPMRYLDHRNVGFGISKDEEYAAYLMNGHERMANFFHAYWYAPELLKEVAPNAYTHFEQWLEHDPSGQAMKPLIHGVKPSLALTGDQRAQIFETAVPGWRDMGRWYAPAETAKVFNNYVSKGLSGDAFYDGIRSAANFLNQAQLSLSGFHIFFTTMDTMISRTALGVEQALRGELGRGSANIAKGMLPLSAVETYFKGRKLGKAYMDPAGATPEMRRIVEGLTAGGGRIKNDKFYQITEGGGAISGIKGLLADWKSGEFTERMASQFKETPFRSVLELPFKVAGKVIQSVTHPIMEEIVPNQKLGVFYDLAQDYLRRNPTASTQQLRSEMGKIWDSVDNRLGQMVYDNVFWNKTGKDLAFIGIRSVGWNLGTVRELGGAVNDAARAVASLRAGDTAEFTHKMAYAISMPVVTALYGALLCYLYTGKGPQSITDYFFPPTGKMNDKGFPERVTVPSYVKDVLEYNRDPYQTVVNKANPVWGAMLGLYNNRDFYGGEIVDKDGDAINQTVDYLKYFGEQAVPFSIRSAEKMSRSQGSTWGSVLGSFGGLQAAPGFITQPELYEAYELRKQKIAKRKKAREQ